MSAETITAFGNTLIDAYSQRSEEIFVRRIKPDSPVNTLFDYIRSLPGEGVLGVGQLDIDGINGGGQYAGRKIIKTSTGNTVSTFVSGDPRPGGGVHTDTTAQWEWRNYWTTIHMRGDILRAGTSGAMWTNMDAWAEKMESAFADIYDQIDTDLCGAGGSGKIDGIDAIFGDTNTYANIDRTSVLNWKSYKKTASAALSLSLLNDVDLTLRSTRRVNYDHILVPIEQEYKAADIIDARRRNVNDIYPGDVIYKGRPIIPIAGLESTHAYFCNSRNWRMRFQPFRNGSLLGVENPNAQSVVREGVPFGLFIGDDGSDGLLVTIAMSCNVMYLNTWESAWLDALTA
tara:strand:+ start:515 stop:1546 length:1032 start_codon:yes stop_codon:yes gene_type:complete